MSLVPGLSPNIRQAPPSGPEPEETEVAPGITLTIDDDGNGDKEVRDENGRLLQINHADGAVTIAVGGGTLDTGERDKRLEWFSNLVDDIAPSELSRIAEDLLRGIQEDEDTRNEWLEERANGLRLLGLKIEIPGLNGAADGAPVEGMSKVRHPLLQEAVLRFQANARSEMLPTDGPVKVRDDNNNGSIAEDGLANALEKDLNHYLTTTASEYYPDTDRMLLMLGFGGTAFKKVYYCPLRNRPVSETVDAEDLIVNNTATDLRNARRITHRVFLRPSVVKRLQILGVYKDVDLSTPNMPDNDAAMLEKKSQQGLKDSTTRPEDRNREIYECYCELDIAGFEHKYKNKVTGLEIPYRVTIDKSSKEVLSIVRNYDKDTKDLPEAKVHFAKYTFVPGFGFYDIGLLHILGNTTNALTAAWRELLDAGMYACFPGFLIADYGARQNTNIFRIPPGGAQQIKTNGANIKDAIMPLPYKEPSPALMQLAQEMAETGMRVGGTSELQVGEGRPDAPVGTTLAMIDQATKVMNSVHKRMHAAQAEEFRLLVACFRDHPRSFWQRNRHTTIAWDEATFMQALNNCNLSPQADPNTASHGQRVMKIMALKQLQSASPTLYDPIAIDTAALQAMGWSDPEQFFAPPQAQSNPPPEMVKMQQEGQAKLQDSQSKMIMAQAKVAEVKAKTAEMQINASRSGDNQNMPMEAAKAKAALMDADTRAKEAELKRGDIALRDAQEQEDRASREKVELLEMAKELILHPQEAPIAGAAVGSIEKGQNNPGESENGPEKSEKAKKQDKKEEVRTKTVTRFHVEKPKRKARGLGGAVWNAPEPFQPPETPLADENEVAQAIRVLGKTVDKLSQGFAGIEKLAQKLEDEQNTVTEVIRDEKGRITGSRKVKRPE